MEIPSNCSIVKSYLIANDPLGQCIAVWTRPVPVFFDVWVVAWRGFNFLNNERSLIPLPILDQSRWTITHLDRELTDFYEDAPTRVILIRIFSNFPTVTKLLVLLQYSDEQ